MAGKWLCLTIATISVLLSANGDDLPCKARDVGIEGRSIVCVCDAEYCDTITRETPEPGTFVVYTSSNAGKRFEKSWGVVETTTNTRDVENDIGNEFDDEQGIDFEKLYNENDDAVSEINVSFRLFTIQRFQTIVGFGGSVTDAASINWRKMTDAVQTRFINTYFGPEGIEYNLIRTPIGGADFSTHPYTLADEPWYDATLSNFSLAYEDYFYKLPMIKRSQQISQNEIKIMASTWSPPIWMKTNERITGFGQLKREYYQTFADYHMRFLEEYKKAEVDIWAITTTNEPINGIVPWAPFNSLGWWPHALGLWVADYLGPTLRSSPFNKTLLFAADEQRYLLHIYMLGMLWSHPRSMNYVDGIAIHYYGNFFPPAVLTNIQNIFPGKMLLSTEACEGPMPWHSEKVSIGSWRRGERYVRSILEDLNNYVAGWIDWNLCLDETGGPNWADNFVDAPILVLPERNEFIKQPMFYSMGHFSKFIPRDSVRVRMARRSLRSIPHLAVLKPDGNLVLVLQNTRESIVHAYIQLDLTRHINVTLEPRSLKTLEINLN